MKNTFTNTNEIKKRLQREIILGIVFMIISLIMLAIINASAQGMGVGINPPVSTLHIYENTANSGTTAGLTIEQNGAGDPVLQYLLTGSTRWMTGIDKTDANKFKIAGNSTDVGTNTRLTIQTTGEVGIGTNSPTSLFSVGSTSQFQVNATGAVAAATGITSSGSITFSGLSTLGIVHNSAAGLLSTGLIVNSDITNGTINLTTKVTGILPIANGGTALSTIPTNGQLLIGNGTNYTLGTLTAGDAIIITNYGASAFMGFKLFLFSRISLSTETFVNFLFLNTINSTTYDITPAQNTRSTTKGFNTTYYLPSTIYINILLGK